VRLGFVGENKLMEWTESLLKRNLIRYNDSPDGDWVIGKYPSDDSLILATAGSGHAYKFLPVIGRLVADLVEDRLDPELRAKFAVERKILGPDPSRSGTVLKLDLDQLCTPADLDPKKL